MMALYFIRTVLSYIEITEGLPVQFFYLRKNGVFVITSEPYILTYSYGTHST